MCYSFTLDYSSPPKDSTKCPPIDIGIYISRTSTFKWREKIKIHRPHNHVPNSTNGDVRKSLNKVVCTQHTQKRLLASENLLTIFEVGNSSLDMNCFLFCLFDGPAWCLRTKALWSSGHFFSTGCCRQKVLEGLCVRLVIAHWSVNRGFSGVGWFVQRTALSGAHPPTVGGRKRSPPITVRRVRVTFCYRVTTTGRKNTWAIVYPQRVLFSLSSTRKI